MGYADKLKQNSSKIQTDEKVLEEKVAKKKKKGRPEKAQKKVKKKAITIAIKQLKKEWIENQASKKSKKIGVKITTYAWMRMTLLKDMMTKE